MCSRALPVAFGDSLSLPIPCRNVIYVMTSSFLNISSTTISCSGDSSLGALINAETSSNIVYGSLSMCFEADGELG